MLIFQNDKGEICDVYENTTGLDLTSAEVTDGTFDGWSKGKILCYKCHVTDGHVDMLTPCVDSRLIRNFDNTQAVKLHQKAYFGEKEKTFYDVPNGSVSVGFDNYNGEYSVTRISNRLTVTFDTLEQETMITVTIM